MSTPVRLFVLAVSAAALLSCRREPPAAGARVAAGPPPVEDADVVQRAARPAGARSPVIWIGLDGLDPEFMDRLSKEGKLPNWSKLVSEGASSKLASFVPMISPLIWTTIATGVGPDVHGVLDFQEVDPASGSRVPVSGFSRAVPAVWNLASASGRRVGVVGWWATYPAEIVNGFFVSDRVSPILPSSAVSAGVAYPPALDSRIASIAAKDGAVGPDDLRPYLEASRDEIARDLSSGRGMDDPVVALARIVSATRITQRVARDLYDRERPDLTAVYFEGTDEIGHVFAAETPPRLPCATEAGFERDRRAAEVYFGAVDRILGQWMRRAREDGATLIVNSDHGFKWGSERTCERSSLESSTAAFWHRIDGVFAAWGARVTPGRDGHPTVFDLAPTVLALLGLPPEPGMKGRPIPVFRGLEANFPRASDVPAVRRVEGQAVSAQSANEYAKKLLALGYLSGAESAPVSARPIGRGPGRTASAYNNLGLYERDVAGDLNAAEENFQRALAIRPGYPSPIFNLAVLYRRRGEDGRARDWLFRALAAGRADPAGTVLEWAAQDRSLRKPAAERELLERAAGLFPDREDLARALADSRFRARDCAGALAAVEKFEAATTRPETLNELALLNTCLGRRDRAVELFHRSLAIAPDQGRVRESLQILEPASP
ncbi:MAG: alkaline phosphatase family protein, partial [Thermoanaerobaculia bacterium]